VAYRRSARVASARFQSPVGAQDEGRDPSPARAAQRGSEGLPFGLIQPAPARIARAIVAAAVRPAAITILAFSVNVMILGVAYVAVPKA